MTKKWLTLVGKNYPLSAHAGNPVRFQASGMEFTASRYDAEGFGCVSVMEAVGMGGAMRMESLILNPFCIDAPLLSCDRVSAMGAETLNLEMFDSMLSPGFPFEEQEAAAKAFRDFPDQPFRPCWYDGLRVGTPIVKKTGAQDLEKLEDALTGYLEAYLRACAEAPVCDPEKKRAKAAAYSEGLLEHGGPATDPVKAAIGEEATASLFRETLFGTE